MSEALFVGEGNPYSDNPYYALYPYPKHPAGGRLCRLVLGLSVKEYLRRFERVGLCGDRWSIREARAAAAEICTFHRGRTIVLLGSKVCRAFDVTFEPFTILNPDGLSKFVILPHPSGLCRLWHRPGAIAEARRVLGSVGIALPEVAG